MAKIRPFDGYLVHPRHSTQVVAPSYDSVSPEQRRKFAEENPYNFLNTMRLMEDYSADSQPSQAQLLENNKKALHALLEKGFFNRFEKPCLFIYQIEVAGHIQTGVVCEMPVKEYEDNFIKKHENTRADKEDLLAQYQKELGVASSPICLTYTQNQAVDELINHLKQRPLLLDFESEDHVKQKIWCVDDKHEQQQLCDCFASIQNTYLTDGHHRAASGKRYAKIMREEKGNNGDESYNQLLVVLFPDNQLNLLPFHRCVKDLHGHSETEILALVENSFIIEYLGKVNDFTASQPNEFGMALNGNWYKLNLKQGLVDIRDPVASLDVVILQDHILNPVFGIKDSRKDARLNYITGASGAAGIQQMQSEGWQAIFVCYATSIQQLMAIADADALMPPKSTYFDPKPRSGIFVSMK